MKNKTIKTIRLIIQVLSFILLPGLFLLIWNSISEIYKALIYGTFTLSSNGSQLLIIFAVIPITMLWGRFFCGYMCAFGFMQDLTNYVAKKLRIKQIKIDKNNDRLLKYIKYIIFLVFILLWTLKISIDPKISPWNIFGMYSSIDGWSNLEYLLTFGGFILLLILISSLFIERVFCKYFCPLGGILSLISKLRLYKIKKGQNKCINCNLCKRNCPMNINVNEELAEFGYVKSSECINCFNCINSCEKGAISTNSSPAISASIAPLAIAGMYYAGNIITNNNYNISTIIEPPSIQGKYTDGTYTGTGQGFRGNIDVTVKVKNGNISSITIDSYKDNDEYFSRAKNTIINEIISNQSLDVDTVSGATYSSKGIIEAVSNALNNKELNNNTTNKEDENKNNNQNNNGSEITSNSFDNLNDGTYTGTGKGRNGNINVTVVVSNKKVTSITIDSYVEDEQYFSRAKSTIINNIISNQSLDVDTVSGATMSSNGIIEAVANALGLSYSNNNSSISNNGHRGHRH